MIIEIPQFSLVAIIGASGSGKTTLARRLFSRAEVQSAESFRWLLKDDAESRAAIAEGYESFYNNIDFRLKNLKFTVIDDLNLNAIECEKFFACARENDCSTVAVVLDIEDKILIKRAKARGDRPLAKEFVIGQAKKLREGLDSQLEGFDYIFRVNSAQQADNLEIMRKKPDWDRRELTGPFDIIGDIHGCFSELSELFAKLGYVQTEGVFRHPEGCTAVFLGDLCDRGDGSGEVLELIMAMVKEGALCVMGNHDSKLLRLLQGHGVRMTLGLQRTLDSIAPHGDEFKQTVRVFLESLPPYYILDGGNLAVVHASLAERYQGRISGRVKSACLFGEATGEKDEFGYPIRRNWAIDYSGRALVVYGHQAYERPYFLNNTCGIDTGCVFGCSLTAYRYPEHTTLSVPAKKIYYTTKKPLKLSDD